MVAPFPPCSLFLPFCISLFLRQFIYHLNLDGNGTETMCVHMVLCYDVYIFSTFTYNPSSLLAPSLPPSLSPSLLPSISLPLSLSLPPPSLPLSLTLPLSSLARRKRSWVAVTAVRLQDLTSSQRDQIREAPFGELFLTSCQGLEGREPS